MSATIPFSYQYGFQSDLYSSMCLDVATYDPKWNQPHFFRGQVRSPRAFAQNLLLLSKVVRTHFFLATPPDYLDPVITATPEILRLEGFSGCCCVYARADLPAAAFDGEILQSGTTNVDFGTPMQLALARITDSDSIRFQVGRDEVELKTSEESVVERKVALPVRWVKSFTEVQALQPRLVERWKVVRDEAVKFFKTLPKGKSPKQTMYAVPSGKGVRLSTRAAGGGVAFCGVHRVAVLQPLLSTCDWLRVWADDETGISGWEISGAAGRFFLLLSPQPYRGFSGEGQNLSTLASKPWEFSQSGFDVSTQATFDRELPLDLSGLQEMQPRLKAAHKLIEKGGVEIAKRISATEGDVTVPGTETRHYVRLRDGGDVCSCRWHSCYQGQRGPCKHILAALMLFEDHEEPRC
ncbi:SWIM zinc finger family protein [Rhodopirellula bahusiensis]|uniref:SWIM zinc finger family protein n=1 Tax=Rhodopirellula bahusiensis TaxID=2014065 RepID=UPI003266CF20